MKLRAVRIPQDLDFLYRHLYCLFPVQNKLRFNNNVDFEDCFIRNLNGYFHDFNIVELNDRTVGFIYSYEFNIHDGHTKIHFYNVDEENIEIFINQLFDEYPFQSIYYETIHEDIPSMFSLCCKLEEYVFNQGKYHDLNVYIKRKDDA